MTSPRPIIMAPGVQFKEADISGYVRELTNSILGGVGLVQKGEKNTLHTITSLTNGLHTFGIPRASHPLIQVLREYFNHGGSRMKVVPVSDGTDAAASATIDDINETTQTLGVPTTGSYYNNQSAQISYGNQADATQKTDTHTFTTGANDYDAPAFTNLPLVPGTVKVKFGGTLIATDANADGTLTFEDTLTQYATYSGTVDYNTGEVNIQTAALSVEVTSAAVTLDAAYWSTFNIQVKYTVKDSGGNQINAPYVIESHRGLTLANMVERLASSIYLKQATAWTKFPVAGTYTFAGGDDGADDIGASDYIGNELGSSPTGMRILARPDSVDINLLAVPKASQLLAVRQAMIQLCEVDRFDTLAILDPPPSLTPAQVIDWADGSGAYSSYDTLDSSYAAAYYPYFTTHNNLTNEDESTPPSAAAAAAFARSNPWEAPAGPIRGKLLNITGIDYDLNTNDRALLYEKRINPISDLNGIGTMVLGQQTTQIAASSLDRVSARMMLMRIEKAITTSLYTLLFEPNTPRTWNQAKMIVQPYLDSLRRRERIYAGEFICDRSTNTDDVINNNIMAAVCRLQLLKTAEIIVVTFLVEALGAKITESLLSQQQNV